MEEAYFCTLSEMAMKEAYCCDCIEGALESIQLLY